MFLLVEIDLSRDDPIRLAAQEIWERCGASAVMTEVDLIDELRAP